MSTKQKVGLAWLVIIAVIVLAVEFTFWPQTITKTGSAVDMQGLKAGEKLALSDSASVDATSSAFFLLRKETGEIIAGVPATKPLGWSNDSYFAAKVDATKGEWIVQDGYNITMHLSGKDGTSLTVNQIPNESNKPLLALLLPIAGLAFWFITMVWWEI